MTGSRLTLQMATKERETAANGEVSDGKGPGENAAAWVNEPDRHRMLAQK